MNYIRAAAYLEIPVGHKLDDVSRGGVAGRRTQQLVVAVEELHRAEVCIAHAHYDDWHGQTGGLYYRSTRLIHVCDHSVCDDEQHVVLLQMDRENWSDIKSTKSQSFIISFNMIL